MADDNPRSFHTLDLKESDILDTTPFSGDRDGTGTCGQHGAHVVSAGVGGHSDDSDASESDAASEGALLYPGGAAAGGSVPLPWGARKERTCFPSSVHIDPDLRPGEFVMRTQFAEFTLQAERKIEAVMLEPLERPLSKSLQRGEDAQFDQLLTTLGSVAEHCLPSLLRTLFAWYDRQGLDACLEPSASLRSDKSLRLEPPPDRQELELREDRRDLAVEFVFCLVLIEVLRQLHLHPGHEDLIRHLENMAFRHFKYRESASAGPNATNVNLIADLYAEVIGVLAQSRFQSVRTRFMHELRDLNAKESSQQTAQGTIALLMGMKFFRVKMVPIEEFEASFQFMQELSKYFLEVKDKDIKHALAGLFVEILVPVAACVKNEVNVPCLKAFVEMLYTHTLDMCTKGKHRLAIFPLVTCLLCVSQKQFFLSNWHYFLAMCLSNLKNKDYKMARVALESLYRLLWVYMVRIKCESNTATQSRLQSIVNSLFPKGSKNVVPRDTPFNIFVKIIQFIAHERLDFAMREIVFDLLSVGRPIKIVTTPERMAIGLRSFLVVADGLQQKEGQPPMPRTVAVLPSGNTLRVKKTFLSTMLTDDTARSIGISAYYPYVRKVFSDILRALDSQLGRPLMMTSTQNVNKEPDEIFTGERKPKIELFRTCVAAIPRLIPDGLTRHDLIDMLARLTVHVDQDLRLQSFQGLQNLVLDFPEWRGDVISGLVSFMSREVADTTQQLLDNGLRILLQLLTTWRNAIGTPSCSATLKQRELNDVSASYSHNVDLPAVLHMVEGFTLVMLCNYRLSTRRLSVHILKEVKLLFKALDCLSSDEMTVIDAMDSACPSVVDRCLSILPSGEKAAVLSTCTVDLQWIAERNSAVWTAGVYDDGARSASLPYLAGADAWRICLIGFLDRQHLPSRCACSVAHSWAVVHHRINSLFSVVDPMPVSDNRASLLRATTAAKRPTDQRDTYMGLWRNYALFACRVVPAVSAPLAVRCTSPEMVSMGASTETGGGDRGGGSDPASLHRLLVPLLRCEGCEELRDGVTEALGRINHLALKDLMLELVVYIREAIDRKQENMRRRRRRDALRLQLISVFEMVADQGTFGLCPGMVDSDTQSLYPMFVEYIDGARLFLESESDKEAAAVQTIKLKFCWFVRKLIKSFPLDARVTLLKRDLRASLFQLFASWSGALGRPFGSGTAALGGGAPTATEALSELELAAVHAAWTVLCCGPVVDPAALHDEAGVVYAGLELLLSSTEPRLHQLARETTVLLLEFNADVSALLDWVVERCYTGGSWIADSCFHSIATVFCTKEYPCDHYTAVINVTLLSTGCPRVEVHETAFQLLQLLDKRFFSREGRHHLSSDNETDAEKQRREHSTLDSRLAAGFSRSQMFLSRQLAQLHPELTMPMFSEITSRLQLARPVARQMMLQYLLPWLHNMELVDPNVQPMSPLAKIQYFSHQTSPRFGGVSCGPQQQHRLEAWGSAEATEMVLNNLLYITAKIGDEHPIEVEQLWAALCSCWPNNLKIILRYLFIMCGMAPTELLPFGRRVVVYLARARPEQLVDEMIRDLQTVESNSYTVERTETPPFYRLTALRKASNHSVMDVSGTGTSEQVMSGSGGGVLLVEKGTIHTKRHSGEEVFQDIVGAARIVSHSGPASIRSSSTVSSGRSQDRSRVLPEDAAVRSQSAIMDNFTLMRAQAECRQQCSPLPSSPLMDKIDTPQPHPLPMPEYGGYFAPLSTYLPHCSQPIANFHRCNLAMMLIQDVLLDGPEAPSAVWPVHVPLMLHVILLGMDHNRSVVHESSKRLLLNLLVVLSRHGDHLSVSRALISCRTELLGYGIAVPPPSISRMQLTDEPRSFDPQSDASGVSLMRSFVSPAMAAVTTASSESQEGSALTTQVPTIVTGDDSEPASLVSVATENSPGMSLPQLCLTLVDYLASRRCVPLWNHEDITAREWNIPSVAQLSQFVDHLVRVFSESLPQVRVPERWAQLALHIALSCSSRHLAGRSLQVFRALCVPITGRMLADILSRLVETVSEQGEDMHGYVTEIMLTLESAVDCVDSDFRPIDFVKELFKSTPNLMNKEPRRPLVTGSVGPTCGSQLAGHLRSTTSYSMSVQGGGPGVRRRCGAVDRDPRGRDAATGVADAAAGASALGRSRSANSLKNMSSADADSEESKLSVLVRLFWLSVSLLESDYEYEYLLAMRLLEKVMSKLSLDRPDCRDKIDKIQLQLHWSSFPGVHALLLKGCTNPATYEPAIALISRFTPLLDVAVVDPSLSMGFPMNVMALLPYMVYHYEDADPFCVRTAENIAQACMERSKKLENLATVMTLYSRRTFSKESLQWTKCVVKYLTDTYGHMSVGMMVFLVEVLEKGPAFVQQPILNVLHCLLHYMDATGNGSLTQLVNTDLLRAMAVCVQQPGQPHWREALRILKLAVTQSSTLSMAPAMGGSASRAAAADARIHVSFAETEPSAGKKELPGRTMEFTFNVSQTPIIGRRLPVEEPVDDVADDLGTGSAAVDGVMPRRFASGGGGSDVAVSGWKRPWLSQIRTRDRLVSLLVSCGTRVGLPKSPSVIFSQNSDALERQSSMASSTEEVSGGQQAAAGAHASVESLDDHEAQQFGVIREFDFLEYELESQEGESMDNFNWGVRRRSLTTLDADGAVSMPEPELSLLSSERASPVHLSQTNTSSSAAGQRDESSEEDEDGGSVSPLEEMTTSADMTADSVLESHQHQALSDSSSQSSCSSSTNGEPANSNELTPCNASLSLSATLLQLADDTLPTPMAGDEDDASQRHTDLEQEWFSRVSSLMTTEQDADFDSSSQAADAMLLFCRLLADIQRGFLLTVDDECVQLVAAPCRPALSGVLLTLQQLQLPHVYVSGAALRVLGVLPRLRFSLLELHEHLLTYQQRRELTLRCLHTARCTLTLQHDDDDATDGTHSTTHQLFRSLYKLHFQLLLLVDGWAKTLSYIAVDATGLVDLTSEVTQLRHGLMAAALLHQDADVLPPVHEHASSRQQAEQSLTRLLGEELCVQALHEFRRQRHLFSPQQIHEGDEVASVLDIYCQQRSESGHLPVVSLGATTQLCTACAALQQANVMLLAALRQHERQMSIMQRAADSHSPSADC